MTPQTGQHVKVILRNGAIAEGIVEEWYANEVQLKSLDGESILIITHPAEDIMLIKIILQQEKAEEPAEKAPEKNLNQLIETAQAALNPEDTDSIKTLAELRIELAKQERRIIAEKLKGHRPSMGPGKVTYGYPGFGKKPST